MNYLAEYQRKLGLTQDGLMGPNTAKAMMEDLGITDKLFFAHMMGQIAHESGLYKNARENLNYSASGLLNIFRKYYTPSLATQHERKPELIANHVYANRMGNGDEASGDGWKYRGIFGLQLTGKDNIVAFIKSLGLPENINPDSLLDDPKNYFLAGKYWFENNNAVKLCDSTSSDCILRVSRKVNIGNTKTTAIPHGLVDRKKQTISMFKALGIV
jgi:putative chitinase